MVHTAVETPSKKVIAWQGFLNFFSRNLFRVTRVIHMARNFNLLSETCQRVKYYLQEIQTAYRMIISLYEWGKCKSIKTNTDKFTHAC